MRLKQIFIFMVLFMVSDIALAKDTGKSSSKTNIRVGIGYDLDIGLTAQYKGYSLFVSNDGFAMDVRYQNFHNDKKTMHLYFDFGGFLENYHGNDSNRDDRVGIRAPIGMTFGMAKNLQAYIQAVPNYDFNNDQGFGVDGAIGIRYRF